MKRTLIETATGAVLNTVDLPDDWTGAEGEWSAPAGVHLEDHPEASPGDSIAGGVLVKKGEEIRLRPKDKAIMAVAEMVNKGTLVPGGNIDEETLDAAVDKHLKDKSEAKALADEAVGGN
jgi:hypothetical protein